MKKLLQLLFLSVLTFTAAAQSFVPSDIRVGDTAVNYANPEISPEGNYMIWVEVDTSNGVSGNVWQCGLDPNTGDLIPANGKGFSPFVTNIYGRPTDWGIDSAGLYYIGINYTGQFVFVRPTIQTTAISTVLPTPADTKRRVIYPSQLPGLDKRFITIYCKQ